MLLANGKNDDKNLSEKKRRNLGFSYLSGSSYQGIDSYLVKIKKG